MKLNIGAGRTSYEGFENVDIVALPNTKHVVNLNNIPWPFPDESCDEMKAIDVLEHLQDTIAIVNEIWRVLCFGGKVEIQVPNVIGSPYHAFTDPTHIRFFSEHTFNYWIPGTRHGDTYGFYSEHKFKLINKEVAKIFIRVVMEKI